MIFALLQWSGTKHVISQGLCLCKLYPNSDLTAELCVHWADFRRLRKKQQLEVDIPGREISDTACSKGEKLRVLVQ